MVEQIKVSGGFNSTGKKQFRNAIQTLKDNGCKFDPDTEGWIVPSNVDIDNLADSAAMFKDHIDVQIIEIP